MNYESESRRDFLRNALITTATLPFLVGCKSQTFADTAKPDILELIKKNAQPRGAEGMGAIDAPTNVSWTTTLSTERDKGEPMEISGTVYQPDGKTIAPNTLIYLYHTDFEGYYGRGSDEHKHGRYRGWMLTDKKGRYSLRSIKAAPYPEMRWAAHIHMSVTGLKQKEDWIDSILFEGDRLISAREREMSGTRGGFQPIVALTKGTDGVLRGTRDIRLMMA
jgi:protocatechuate 3,4-dioxygenase, beta subunit